MTDSVVGTADSVSMHIWVIKNFIIIATSLCPVAKKVNIRKRLPHQMLQTERLVPARRENVNADLAANAKGQAVVGELALQGGHHGAANVLAPIQLGKLDALRLRT